MSTHEPGESQAPRERLVAAAIRLLEEGGPEALQARRLGAEIGASTMAVYTYFGGMGQLVEAVAREGFIRLGQWFAAVPVSEDPVLDIVEIGMIYRDFGLASPQLFRVMYGLTAPGGHRLAGMDVVSGQMPEGLDAFEYLVRAVRRAIETGDGCDDDPFMVALQLWTAAFGYVVAEIAGYYGTRGLDSVMLPMLVRLMSGLGHSEESVRRGVGQALSRGAGPGT